MRSANGKNMASRIDARVNEAIDRKGARYETQSDVRDQRMGWRGTGILQYARYYSTEGVYSIGLGGPPVVGR